VGPKRLKSDIHFHGHENVSCPCAWLSTTQWRRMGEWMYRFAFSWPWLHPPYLRGKARRNPLDRNLDGPQSWSERCEVENIFWTVPRMESNPSSQYAVTTATELHRLGPRPQRILIWAFDESKVADLKGGAWARRQPAGRRHGTNRVKPRGEGAYLTQTVYSTVTESQVHMAVSVMSLV
jgi:hypothetical protein